MPIQVRVKIDGLKRLRQQVVNNPALGKAIAGAWSTIYRAFTRQRFYKNSRGGGDWPPLSQRTIDARRKGKGSGSPAILRDTGTMFAAIQPNLDSNGLLQSRPRPLGFTAFLGGHRTYKDGATLVQVAEFHHKGSGHLPKRTILVIPGANTIKQMATKAKQIALKFMGDR